MACLLASMASAQRGPAAPKPPTGAPAAPVRTCRHRATDRARYRRESAPMADQPRPHCAPTSPARRAARHPRRPSASHRRRDEATRTDHVDHATGASARCFCTNRGARGSPRVRAPYWECVARDRTIGRWSARYLNVSLQPTGSDRHHHARANHRDPARAIGWSCTAKPLLAYLERGTQWAF